MAETGSQGRRCLWLVSGIRKEYLHCEVTTYRYGWGRNQRWQLEEHVEEAKNNLRMHDSQFYFIQN